MVFNATFNNISVVAVSFIGGVNQITPGENHWPVTGHWQTLSQALITLNPTQIGRHKVLTNTAVYKKS
jgi:hypothetical protein